MMKVPALSCTTSPLGQLSRAAWIAAESSWPLGEIVAQTVVRAGIPPTDIRPGYHGKARSEGRIPVLPRGGLLELELELLLLVLLLLEEDELDEDAALEDDAVT